MAGRASRARGMGSSWPGKFVDVWRFPSADVRAMPRVALLQSCRSRAWRPCLPAWARRRKEQGPSGARSGRQ
eukprot:9687169-Lingulodinium_polyedra.AAC.1